MIYEVWLEQVQKALKSINMSMDDWQPVWPFDFSGEHDKGTDPNAAAMKANRFWWYQEQVYRARMRQAARLLASTRPPRRVPAAV